MKCLSLFSILLGSGFSAAVRGEQRVFEKVTISDSTLQALAQNFSYVFEEVSHLRYCAIRCSENDDCYSIAYSAGKCYMFSHILDGKLVQPSLPADWNFHHATSVNGCNLKDGYHLEKALDFCYKLFYKPEKTSWNKANDLCKEDLAHLATIDSLDKYNVIDQHARANIDHGIGGAVIFFVDGNERNTEGEWLDWKNHELKWTLFYPGEPNNFNYDEDCMALMSTRNYKMIDVPCWDTAFGYYYYCEKKLDRNVP